MSTPAKSVLILASTSDIGRAIAHAYAAHGWSLQLAARNLEQLRRDAEDFKIRHQVRVSIYELDVTRHESLVDFSESLSPLPDTAICVVGLLGNQSQCERDLKQAPPARGI